jgi:hypothetical protein
MRAKTIWLAGVMAAGWMGGAVSMAQQQAPPASATQQAPAKAAPPRRNPVPDTFTNLQVLPKDIAKGELVAIMKNFSFTTERRCSFCHVATDDLSEADFAADDKEPKKKARDLLRAILDAKKEAPKSQP